MNIGAGHDTTDSAAYHLQGNIWRALRAGALHDFSQWVAPDAVTIYRGHVGLLTKNGDSDYTLDEDTIQSSATATAPGNTAHQLDFGFTSELHFEKDDYFLVAVATGSADADGRQQANPLISQTVGLLDYITHAKFDAAPTAGDNVWHMNPTNQGYRQRLGIVATSVDELVIEKDGATVYSGPNLWDVTDPEGQVVAGDAKIALTLYPERIIVSETEPPDPADVADIDLGKMYVHVNADGVIKSVSYIREVDESIFSLSTTTYTLTGQVETRGADMDSNNGYFIPWRNFEQIALTRAAGAVLVVHFDDAVMEPFDYTSHANLTLYRRLKGATGSWGHHQLARESDEYKYEKLGISNAFFGDGARYDLIFRTGSHGDGTVATVPEANRLIAYPGGIKREYLPTSDTIDNITQLYDIIRESTTAVGTFEGLTDTPVALGTAGQVPAVNTAEDCARVC